MKRIFMLPAILGYFFLGTLPTQAQYWGPSPALTHLGQKHAAQAVQTKSPKSWQQVLQEDKEHYFDNIPHTLDCSLKLYYIIQAENDKKNKFLKTISPKQADRWEKNYQALNTALKRNPLFKYYQLYSIELMDFYAMSNDEILFLKQFFAGNIQPVKATQYDHWILLLLKDEKGTPYWLAIDLITHTIYLNYKDYNKLKKLPGDPISNKGKPLVN